MPSYRYIARNLDGRRIEGVLDSESQAGALRALDEQRLFPVTVEPAPERTHTGLFDKVRSRDVGQLYAQLADLLGSGVPLMRSMDILVDTTVNKRLQAIVRDVRNEVADGTSLTDAMRQHPEAFPSLHAAMVQAGERAGFLEDVLANLAGFTERIDELRNKVIGSLLYPVVLVLLGLAIMVGGLLFFVPVIAQVLRNADDLPLPTIIVFAMSDMLRGYWFVALLAMAGAAVGAYFSFTSDAGRRRWERLQMRLPMVGLALRMVAITRFCRILGTMLANGVPLVQALQISRDASGSTLLRERIEAAIDAVRDGQSLTQPLGEGDLFPKQILAMITVAEESNRLEKVLLQIADTVERRTNRQVDQAVRMIEPLALCLVAGGIGFMALGLLLPVFTIAGSLGGS